MSTKTKKVIEAEIVRARAEAAKPDADALWLSLAGYLDELLCNVPPASPRVSAAGSPGNSEAA